MMHVGGYHEYHGGYSLFGKCGLANRLKGMRPQTNQRRLMSKAGKTKDIIIPTEPPRV